VRFGTTTATVLLWSNVDVLIRVPNLAPGTYAVTVTVGTRTSNVMNFTVTALGLGSITPNNANPGANVTIAGTGFGATQGTSTVRFGTTNAAVASWSNTQIVATVPNLAQGGLGVTVVVNGVTSNSINFNVTSAIPPAITTLSPTSGAAGSTVTITGTNFGNSQGSSTVRFGATNAVITSYSNTQIVVTVPAIAAGLVQVNVIVNGNNMSNSVNFTVTVTSQPNYSFACPATLSVNRSANGAVTCTLTRTGGFTGSVAFTVSGLPSGVTATASPASTTGNATAVTFTAGAAATLGTANVTVSAAATGFTTRTAAVALTIASGSTGGSVTAAGVVVSNSPWFAEEQVQLSNTATVTALTVTITVARNPASLVSSGQYNTIGGSTITQSLSTTSTQVVYTFTLASGQSLPAGTGRTFAAQMSPGGTLHATTGDTWTVTSTSGGSSTTTSGTF
jgi:hypothetical protein